MTIMDDVQNLLNGALFDPNVHPSHNLWLLGLRLLTLVVLVAALMLHIRSVRVFRWEQSVSGGVLVTFCIAVLGLALCSGAEKCGASVFQSYIACFGAFLLSINAYIIWYRWHDADELTLAVAELLQSLGMPLTRHIKLKVFLSSVAALGLLLDLIVSLMRKGA